MNRDITIRQDTVRIMKANLARTERQLVIDKDSVARAEAELTRAVTRSRIEQLRAELVSLEGKAARISLTNPFGEDRA